MLKKAKPLQIKRIIDRRQVKESLGLSFHDYLYPLIFLLSATMIGLHFPPGYVIMLIILINSWRKDRYDFIIQFTIFSAGISLLLPYYDLFFPYDKCIFIICIILAFIYKKDAVVKKICIAIAIYAIILLYLATLSEESLRNQMTSYVNWLSLIYFILPLVLFGKEEFDLRVFLRKLMPYMLIICIFYIFDGIILSGNFFMPRDHWAFAVGHRPTFYDFYLRPFSFHLVRIWPQGLYLAILCLYGFSRYYKMSLWQWIVFILALIACRTFTLYVALLVCWVVSQKSNKLKLKIALYALLFVFVGYFVDTEPVFSEGSGYQSTLRIKSTIKQFTDLADAKDIDDYANFGSTRMSVALPSIFLVYELDKEWTGLGFISREKSKVSKYEFESEFEFLDPDDFRKEMTASGGEIDLVQVFVNTGYIGLIVHITFYLAIWLFVRKLKYSNYFASVLIGFIILGLSGYAGIIYYISLYLCGLSLAAVLLSNRTPVKEKRSRLKYIAG